MGNLLENAVEACGRLSDQNSKQSKIELSVKTQGAQLAIMVKNDFDGNVEEENGQIVTTKESGGFGLRSVRAIAARYDGHIITEWDKDNFTVYVLLNNTSL